MIDIFSKKKVRSIKHLAIDIGSQGIGKENAAQDMLMALQVESNIPIITIRMHKARPDELSESLDRLSRSEMVHKNKIRVSVLGKWYSLPGSVIDSVRRVIEETKYYDSFFFNICINYDGQEEIVDACKLISNKILSGKISLKEINKDLIKENLYTSYFVPPDIIIYTKGAAGGFLLWDSAQSKIFYSDLLWKDFKKDELIKILKRC